MINRRNLLKIAGSTSVVLLHAGRYKLDVEDAVRPIEMAFGKFILPSIKN